MLLLPVLFMSLFLLVDARGDDVDALIAYDIDRLWGSWRELLEDRQDPLPAAPVLPLLPAHTYQALQTASVSHRHLRIRTQRTCRLRTALEHRVLHTRILRLMILIAFLFLLCVDRAFFHSFHLVSFLLPYHRPRTPYLLCPPPLWLAALGL